MSKKLISKTRFFSLFLVFLVMSLRVWKMVVRGSRTKYFGQEKFEHRTRKKHLKNVRYLYLSLNKVRGARENPLK